MAGPGRNVIVIVTDSLRADHVGCYGSHVQTPNLDRLAAESALFEQAYAENLPTLPCRTAWWTGKYLFPERGWQHFEPTDYLLAEVLWDRGLTSALITDTYHMHKPVYNCGRGFDTTVFVRGQEYDPWVVDPGIAVDLGACRLRGDQSDEVWRERYRQYLRNATRFVREEDYCVARVVREAVRWLEDVTQRQRENLFLWVDCFDPHEPWDPPSPYREMYDPDYEGPELIDPVPGPVAGYMTERELQHTRALYAGEVTFVDQWVGVLLQAIRELGLYENSLIMHTSDHGEPFGEHGIVRKAQPWGYEELARIPWLVRHPGGLGAGQRYRAFAQPPDLMPTVLEFLGVPAELTLPYLAPVKLTFPQDIAVSSRQVRLTGQSLLPLLRGEVEQLRDCAVTGHHQAEWVIRTEEWSYFLPLQPNRPRQLYHRATDRAEQVNVLEAHREVGDALELKLRRFAEEVSA